MFGGTAGTQWEDPEVRRRALALSEPTDRIDVFVSHSWRAPRWLKYLALLLHFNAAVAVRIAAVAGFVTAIFELRAREALPEWTRVAEAAEIWGGEFCAAEFRGAQIEIPILAGILGIS